MTEPWNQTDGWSDLDNDGGDDAANKSNPVRQRMRELEKANKTLMDQNKKLAEQMRHNTVADTVKAKGFSEKVAKLIPADLDPTGDAIDKWLQDYADVLTPIAATPSSVSSGDSGGEGGAGDEGEGSQYGLEMGRIADATSVSAPPQGKQAEIARELASKDLKHERLLEMIHQAGGGFGSG